MGFFEKVKNMFTEEVEEDDVKVEQIKKEVTKVSIESPNAKKCDENIDDFELKFEEKINKPVCFDDRDFRDLNLEEPKEEKKVEVKEKSFYKKNLEVEKTAVEKEKKTFKPTPIISPVYGILNKNYHKEDIVSRKDSMNQKEDSISSIDAIRNKAYGTLEDELENTLFGSNSILFKKDENVEDELQIKIDGLQAQVNDFKSADNSLLKNEKRALQEELEDITKTLGKKDTNAELKKRMEELNQEEKDLQIKIAELEGQQYLGEEFIRTKVELLEDSINKKFKGAVTFKLFNQQVNGGLAETCEALINGVPFSNANTASQINAGLSIINTLCEHYNISAPVFIDNAEAINEINKTDSQLIKLVVSLDKKLKVEVDK